MAALPVVNPLASGPADAGAARNARPLIAAAAAKYDSFFI
jgi:hypothetical protein